jgi:hypothetical protein
MAGQIVERRQSGLSQGVASIVSSYAVAHSVR